MENQSVRSQKGEIEFRRKLVQQQVEQKSVLNDEFTAEGIKKILGERIKKTSDQMCLLRKEGVNLSPYVEIGSERCQRALVMENDFNATGAAVDISYDMLKSCDHYKYLFNRDKVPLRICCDANHLPLRSGSVPFVFCYETLHHFPDPTPIIKDIHRIISPGGHFFFDEEPYKRILHLKLYKGKKIYSKESPSRNKIKKIFDAFFAEKSCNEVSYGIVENDEIPIAVWKRALSLFKEKNVKLQSIKAISSELFVPKHYLKFLLAYLFGGTIYGTCRKSGNSIGKEPAIRDALICPSCSENGRESNIDHRNLWLLCSECGKKFPIIDGVIFLLPYKKLEELYPEIFDMVKNDNDVA
jgi:ubiquinone/menaquinone biosynthesis C-methylase UbiE